MSSLWILFFVYMYFCIKVNAPLKYIAVSPLVIVIQPLPVVVDTTIELTCTISEIDPARNITWIFNGTVIRTGSTSLNISIEVSIADYGMYTCSASNEFGSDSATVEIVQAGIVMCLYIIIELNYHIAGIKLWQEF